MTTQPELLPDDTSHALATTAVLAIDTETTGVDPATARLVQLAAYAVQPDGTAEPVLATLVDAGVDIPAEAAAVHGITTEQLAGAPTIREVVRSLHHLLYVTARLRVPWVAYNAPYDLGVLQAELGREALTLPVPLPPIIDPLVLDRYVDRYRKGSRKLQDTARHYGLQLPDGLAWHDAQADCLAAAHLAHALLDASPELHPLTLPELHAVQQAAHQEWLAGYNRWRDGKGLEPITGGWPL